MSREDAPSAPTVSYVVITTSWSASLQWWERDERERREEDETEGGKRGGLTPEGTLFSWNRGK